VTATPGALTLCCADMDARPLFWTLADGHRDGYEPAVAALVAERLDLELVWEYRRWDGFRSALEAGEVDAIWCGSAITKERRKVFSYSRPYAAFDEGVLAADSSGIRSIEDLHGRSVGAIAGSTNMRLAETLGAGHLVGYDGSSDDVFAEMLEAVAAGEIDAMVDDMPAFGGVLDRGGFRLVHVAHTQNAWGAACRLGDTATVAAIDSGLGAAVADGSIEREWRRWFPDMPVPGILTAVTA
jgi:polar amino acid transport system substrate-binding protein